jgi:hypothetical protein
LVTPWFDSDRAGETANDGKPAIANAAPSVAIAERRSGLSFECFKNFSIARGGAGLLVVVPDQRKVGFAVLGVQFGRDRSVGVKHVSIAIEAFRRNAVPGQGLIRV